MFYLSERVVFAALVTIDYDLMAAQAKEEDRSHLKHEPHPRILTIVDPALQVA